MTQTLIVASLLLIASKLIMDSNYVSSSLLILYILLNTHCEKLLLELIRTPERYFEEHIVFNNAATWTTTRVLVFFFKYSYCDINVATITLVWANLLKLC